LSTYQYALEEKPAPRWDLDLHWKAGISRDSSEIRLVGFAATGTNGDWSIDLDPIVYRYVPFEGPAEQLWFGRQHPFEQGLQSTGAIGTNWRQNQTDALAPRISGWIGTGARYRLSSSGLRVSVAYSPIFIPNFGPALTLSESKASTGSRFARLPPSYVRLDQAVLPLRYMVDVGDLKDIILQNQFFVSIDQEAHGTKSAFMAWSAPAPSPEIDANATLRVSEESANVLVTAKPKFRREMFIGAKAQWQNTFMKPEVETALELTRPRLGMSWRGEIMRAVHIGVLHTFVSASAKSTSATPDSPNYAERLGWVNGTVRLTDTLSASLRVEHHFTPGKNGTWTRPSLELSPSRKLKIFAQLSVLTGDDFGWFGTWRSLDSFNLGAKYTW